MRVPTYAATPSPYADEQTRDIKSLSSEEVHGYLGGKGMGLAKSAELNGYPGPAHVMALTAELGLTSAQKQRTEALFAGMEARAKALGSALVDEERQLDALFASKSITRASLAATLARIADLQRQLRETHLQTHLAQVEILTPAQVAKYATLRGYSMPGRTEGHAGHKH